ncbi:MAG: RING finger domain-containing protein [Promethearchaeota archaeon]|jgi:hypothetical protein
MGNNICKRYKLYRRNHGNNDYEKEECPICLVKFENNKFILKCGHKFHKQCLKRWVTISPICPLCRENIYDPELFKNKQPHKEDQIIFY